MNVKHSGILIAAVGLLASGLAAQDKARLAGKYETWLSEEVVYIISAKEKKVFRALESDRDRDRFIEEFWRQRDPTPTTPRNEYRDEHTRRIDFANATFGRGSPGPGWRTERGRFYIMLGPPIDVHRLISDKTYPVEIWLYQGLPALGQPALFRLVFYQERGARDYVLYNPLVDGPEKLVPDPDRTTGLDFMNGRMDETSSPMPGFGYPASWSERDQQAYKIIREYVSDELAEASLTILPGVRNPSGLLSTSILLSQIEMSPQKRVREEYAEDFLNHKATVEVSYSVSHVENSALVSVLRDPAGPFFVNYVLVPEKLSLDSYGDRYFADLKASIRLTDASGRTVYQQEKDVPLELRKDELKLVEKKTFHFTDSFPVIPGSYTFHLLWENTVTREFTTLEKQLTVPSGNELAISPFVLARSAVSGSPAAAARRAYKVGTTQLTPDPGLTFHVGENLYLFYQVFGLSPELRESGVIRTTVGKPGTRGTATRKSVKEAGGGPDFLETIPLDATPAGTYVVAVELLDGEDRPQASGAASFKVSSTGLPGFWVYGPSNPGPEDASHDYRLGTQFLVVGDAAKARDALARAHAKAPQSLEYATAYGQALLAAGDAAKALETLRPLAAADTGDYDLFAVAGRAAQAAGDLKAAIGYYGKALAARGRMADILNALGECHLGLGDKALAEKAWRESLAVNPAQDEIRTRLAKLKN